MFTVAVCATNVVATVLSGQALDRLGRKPLLTGSFIGMGISCLVISYAMANQATWALAGPVAVVAVMSKPHRCPHIATTGNICVYCPGGPDSDFEYSTQSYTGYEPTSMRAIRARYDPYVQARGRVDQLRRLGHSVDKVGLFLFFWTFIFISVRAIGLSPVFN